MAQLTRLPGPPPPSWGGRDPKHSDEGDDEANAGADIDEGEGFESCCCCCLLESATNSAKSSCSGECAAAHSSSLQRSRHMEHGMDRLG